MFDLAELNQALEGRGGVARVVIAACSGSCPREVGASMLVWGDGQTGSIGGGALEWQAVCTARAALQSGRMRFVQRIPLGPALGQCCGGAVTLLTEVFTALSAPKPQRPFVARPLEGEGALSAPTMPLGVQRFLRAPRNAAPNAAPRTRVVQGWLIEPLARKRRPVWVWGAGHVGRAVVQILAPLPDVEVSWVDFAEARFLPHISLDITQIPAANPADMVQHAPKDAQHMILTFSHQLDLELCHRALCHGFARCGLIGSDSKWARFRTRLSALGHAAADIARIECPIGAPKLGKHPQAIAISIAHQFLTPLPAAQKKRYERPQNERVSC